MNEIVILNVIKNRMSIILNHLKNDFSYHKLINWIDEPGIYETDVDCAATIGLSFKHLVNEDNEDLILEVHINKVQDFNTFLIEIYLTHSNGVAIEYEEIPFNFKNKNIHDDKNLEKVFDLLNIYYEKIKQLIISEYTPQSQDEN